MAEKRWIQSIRLEGAHIYFKHFSGAADEFHREGERDFRVVIPEELAPQLIEDGWNIKSYVHPETGETSYSLAVSVSYKLRDPEIYIYNNQVRRSLTQETVECLDNAEIENIDMIINPYLWELNGKSGVKAYLKEMHVTLKESYFANKYAAYTDAEEPVPFN